MYFPDKPDLQPPFDRDESLKLPLIIGCFALSEFLLPHKEDLLFRYSVGAYARHIPARSINRNVTRFQEKGPFPFRSIGQ